MMERYLNAASASYDQQEFAKAFDYISYVYSQYEEGSVPQNVQTLAEKIYYQYLSKSVDSGDEDSYSRIVEKLEDYPSLKSSRITNLLIQTGATTREAEVISRSEQSVGTATVSSDGTLTYSSPIANSPATSQELLEYKEKLARTQGQLDAMQKQLDESKKLSGKDREEE
ncbi:MAG: hypothetical protein K5839_05145, partial [Treponemataceae bacterium]|nr:hypothetical protein [Treponemataceae bacterium]